MAIYRSDEDVWYFGGAKAMALTVNNTAMSDQSRSHMQSIARITDTAHGYQAGSLIYLQGFANSIYNGIKQIDAVATNTFDVFLGLTPFAALTPAGTETGKPIVTYDEEWELLGFELHLSAAAATSENFTATIDADKGAAWDSLLYSKDMSGVGDIVQSFTQPRPLSANDLLIFNYANTDSRTWGLKVITRRRAN